MKKEITLEQAVSYVKDGMTVMVGGFLGVGAPLQIMDALAESGVKDLTVICNDTAFPDKSLGNLVVNKQIKKLIVSQHIVFVRIAFPSSDSKNEDRCQPPFLLRCVCLCR